MKTSYETCSWDIRYAKVQNARLVLKSLKAMGIKGTMCALQNGQISIKGSTITAK